MSGLSYGVAIVGFVLLNRTNMISLCLFKRLPRQQVGTFKKVMATSRMCDGHASGCV